MHESNDMSVDSARRRRGNLSARRLATLSVLLAAITAALPAAESTDPSMEDLAREFLTRAPPDFISGAREFNAHGFRLEASHYRQLGQDLEPNGDEFDAIVVEAQGLFKTIVSKGSAPSAEGGIAVFHRDTGTPMLDMGDTDGDGRMDVVSYSVVDEKGDVTIQVTDYEADGQADFRLHFIERYFEIWHGDRWHRVEARDGKRGINIDGKFIELRREKYRWLVP